MVSLQQLLLSMVSEEEALVLSFCLMLFLLMRFCLVMAIKKS